MSARWIGCLLLFLVVAVAYSQPGATPAENRPGPMGPGPMGPGAKPGMAPAIHPQWEYSVETREKIMALGKDDFLAGLNKLGDQGWELVTAQGSGGTSNYYFKRAKGGFAGFGGMPAAPGGGFGAPGGLGGGLGGLGGGPGGPGGAPGGPGGAPGGLGGGPGGLGGPRDGGADPRLIGSGPMAGMGPRGMGEPANEPARILSLKHAKATQVGEIVQKLYGGRSLRVASDERTNVIILVAPEKQLKEAMKLIAELDSPTPDKK